MQDNEFKTVRLRFSKTASAKYISHLDVNRVMSRAIKRADLPVWYTQGYNPRVYMSFSLPLPLSVESECESVDLRLVSDIEFTEIIDKMNAVLPRDIRIADVYNEFSDLKEISYSTYIFDIDFKNAEDAEKKIKSILASEEIIAEKKGKSGRKKVAKEVNIKEFIKEYSVERKDKTVVIKTVLSAGVQKNLSPILLFDTIIKLMESDYEWKSIKRINLLKSDMTEYI